MPRDLRKTREWEAYTKQHLDRVCKVGPKKAFGELLEEAATEHTELVLLKKTCDAILGNVSKALDGALPS
jgi:hypothetical protein